MTATTTAPSALEQYLDAGGRPEALPFFDVIADAFTDEADDTGPFVRPDVAANYYENLTTVAPRIGGTSWTDESWHTFHRHMVDLIESRALRDRFLASMASASRRRIDEVIDLRHRPIALDVVSSGHELRCGVCGHELARGAEHVRLTSRDKLAGIRGQDALTICASCVGRASQALSQIPQG